jgi:hypothetical protein
MKHPGHTYGGFVSAISERGMTLILLNGIVRIIFLLRPQWASNVGVNSRGLFIPEHEGER